MAVDDTGTYVLTNRHVVDGATPSSIRLMAPDGKVTYHVEELLANSARDGTAGDLAILKLAPTSLRPLAFGNSARLSAGQTVASIGYGLAFQLAGAPSVTEGIISAVDRNLNDGFGGVWIQHQSTINHGNSGGPLLDMRGDVVGVNTLSIDQLAGASGSEPVQGVFFAIPINLAQQIAQKLIDQLRAHSITTTLRAFKPAPSRFAAASFTVSLPRGWIFNLLKRNQPVALSRDQLVQVVFEDVTARHGMSQPQLRRIISQLVHKSGKIRRLSFQPIEIARLHGLAAMVTYKSKAYRASVVALPDTPSQRVLVLATFIRSGASRGDVHESTSLIQSVRLVKPARRAHR